MNYIYNNQTRPTRDLNRFEFFSPSSGYDLGTGPSETDGNMFGMFPQRSLGRNSSMFKKTIYKKHSDSIKNNFSNIQVDNSTANISKAPMTATSNQQSSTIYGNFNRYSSQNYYYYYSAPSNLVSELNRLKNSSAKKQNYTLENKNDSVYCTKTDKLAKFNEPQAVKSVGRCNDKFFAFNSLQNKSNYSTFRYSKVLNNIPMTKTQLNNKNNVSSKNSNESESLNDESSVSSFTSDLNSQTNIQKKNTFFNRFTSNSNKAESIIMPNKTSVSINKTPIQVEKNKFIINNYKGSNGASLLRTLNQYKPSYANKIQTGTQNDIYPNRTNVNSIRTIISKPLNQQSIYMNESLQYKKLRDSKDQSSTTKLLSSFSSSASSESSDSNNSNSKLNDSSPSSLSSSDKYSISGSSSISNHSIDLNKNVISNISHKPIQTTFLQQTKSKAEPFKNLYKNSTKSYETKADFTANLQRSDFLRASIQYKKDANLKITYPRGSETECKQNQQQQQQQKIKISDNLISLNEECSGKENENLTPSMQANKPPARFVYDIAKSIDFEFKIFIHCFFLIFVFLF